MIIKNISYTSRVGLLLLASSTLPAPAGAEPKGEAKYTGKQGATCVVCHKAEGAVPTVELIGPDRIEPGASAKYTLEISGGPAKVGGMGVALSDGSGAVLEPGPGSKIKSGELVQNAPLDFTGGRASWEFHIVAPASPGSLTVYAVGLSADDDGGDEGDGVEAITMNLNIGAMDPAPGSGLETEGGGHPPVTESQPLSSQRGGCSIGGGAGGMALFFLLAWALVLAPRRLP
jgi:hypothetical protein